jgi:polysaccharide export outer membrane protein
MRFTLAWRSQSLSDGGRPISFLRQPVLMPVICLLFVSLPGCGGGQKAQPTQAELEGSSAPINAWLANQAIDVPAAVYHVGSPDKIMVVAPRVKEIDGKTAVVRSDGRISMNMVGELNVGGLTPAEISELIVQRLSKYYKADEIDVSVQVTEFKSRVYYVMGQVIVPGIKPYTGSDTILKVLADAKLNDEAWPQRVVIVRPNEDVNVKQRVTVNLKDMFEHGIRKQDFLIEAGDVVFVPPSPLAEASATFKKILFPIIPAGTVGLRIMGGGI